MNSAGTGLGLSICKQLIEQMGGEVQVTSQLGVGTTFSIIITTKSRVDNVSDSSPANRNIGDRKTPQSSTFLESPNNKFSKNATGGKTSEEPISGESIMQSIKSKKALKNKSKFSIQHRNMDEDSNDNEMS